MMYSHIFSKGLRTTRLKAVRNDRKTTVRKKFPKKKYLPILFHLYSWRLFPSGCFRRLEVPYFFWKINMETKDSNKYYLLQNAKTGMHAGFRLTIR